jgi:hypothetical protein
MTVERMKLSESFDLNSRHFEIEGDNIITFTIKSFINICELHN